jgi:hypothetical protein
VFHIVILSIHSRKRVVNIARLNFIVKTSLPPKSNDRGV